jgi:hypothetical protein
MKKQSYSDKLKDPRWQKKRLEAMEHREFSCEVCSDNTSTLHVHHKEYIKGREIWEYQVEQLAVLCEDCHEDFHTRPDILKIVCSFAFLDGPRNRDELAFVLAGHLNLNYEEIIEVSELNPVPVYAAAYEAGQKISKIQEMYFKIFLDAYKKEEQLKDDINVNPSD